MDANAHNDPSEAALLDELLATRPRVLQSYGFTRDFAFALVPAAMMLDRFGGASASSYWKRPHRDVADLEQMRDELHIVSATYYLTVVRLLQSAPVHDYQRQFIEAFGFLSKSMLESVRSIEVLAAAGCYIDGLSICRTICGRLNLMVLLAANPALFDDWLRNPTDEKYLDGHIRDVLDGHDLEFHGQLYDELSEAIHLHETILAENEYLKGPPFRQSTNMQFRLYALAKLLLARAAYVGMAMYRQDLEGRSIPPDGAELIAAWPALEELTAHNRLEHLFTLTLAPDRHVRKVGKNTALLGKGFGYEHVGDQLEKFHRDRGQRKRLRKPYDRVEPPVAG